MSKNDDLVRRSAANSAFMQAVNNGSARIGDYAHIEGVNFDIAMAKALEAADAIERGAAQGVTDEMVERAALEIARQMDEAFGWSEGTTWDIPSAPGHDGKAVVLSNARKMLEAAFAPTPPAPAPDAGEEHPEDHCRCCGQSNPVWSAPNDLWNRVMGGSDGILCPRCFIDRAEMVGAAPKIWMVGPAPQPSSMDASAVSMDASPTPQPPAVEAEAEKPVAWRISFVPVTLGNVWHYQTEEPVHRENMQFVGPLYSEAALKAKTDEIERLRYQLDEFEEYFEGVTMAEHDAGVRKIIDRAEAAEASNKALREKVEKVIEDMPESYYRTQLAAALRALRGEGGK